MDELLLSKVRLAVIAQLVTAEWVTFAELQKSIDVTDGNLASHLRVLEEHRYVRVKKEFVGRKPQTSYLVTEAGRRAFRDHLEGLERVIRSAH